MVTEKLRPPEDQPVLITGIPRSGVRIVGRFLQDLGYWCGPWLPHAPWADTENQAIRNSIYRPLFRGLRADVNGLRGLPVTAEIAELAPRFGSSWRRQTERIMEKQGCSFVRWFYSGPDVALVWPMWKEAYPKAKWVIVRRNTDDVLRSCRKTGYVIRTVSEEKQREWAAGYHEKFAEIRDSGVSWIEVWPSKWISSGHGEAKALVDFLGSWNDETAMFDALAPIRWSSGIFDGGEV